MSNMDIDTLRRQIDAAFVALTPERIRELLAEYAIADAPKEQRGEQGPDLPSGEPVATPLSQTDLFLLAHYAADRRPNAISDKFFELGYRKAEARLLPLYRSAPEVDVEAIIGLLQRSKVGTKFARKYEDQTTPGSSVKSTIGIEYDKDVDAMLLKLRTRLISGPSGSGEDSKYMELIYAVARKFPGETRHQTALRYIMEAEARGSEAGSVKAGEEGRTQPTNEEVANFSAAAHRATVLKRLKDKGHE